MDLNSILLNRLTGVAETAPQAKKAVNSDYSFENFIESAKSNERNVTKGGGVERKDEIFERKAARTEYKKDDNTEVRQTEKKQPTKKTQDKQTNKVKENDTRDDTVKTKPTEKPTSETNKTEKTMAKGENTAKETNNTVENDSSVKLEQNISLLALALKGINDVNEELKGKLADLLGVSVENVSAVLESLNLTALDLTDKANLNTFMQSVYGVNDAVQLLNVPNINQVFEKANSIISGYTEFADIGKLVDEFANQVSNDLLELNQGNESTEGSEDVIKNIKDTLMEQITFSENISPEPKNVIKNVFNILQSQTETLKQNITQKETNSDVPVPVTNPVNVIAAPDKPVMQNGQFSGNNQDSFFAEQNRDMGNISNQAANVTANPAKFLAEIKAELQKNINQPANNADVVNQIVDRVKVEIRGNITEMRLNLKPEHLGDVTLKVLTENGIVTAQFVAENQRVKEIIEANFNQLRNTLQQQGINVSQLSVSVGQDNQKEKMDSFLQGQNSAGKNIKAVGVQGTEVDEDAAELDYNDPYNLLNSRVNYTV